MSEDTKIHRAHPDPLVKDAPEFAEFAVTMLSTDEAKISVALTGVFLETNGLTGLPSALAKWAYFGWRLAQAQLEEEVGLGHDNERLS